MSLNITPLRVVEVRDNRTLIRNKQYALLKGGSQVSWKPYTTTSVSSSSIQFSTPPPNPKIFIDRKMYIQLPVRLVLNCSVPNAFPLLRAGYDAPRSYPVSSSLNTLAVNINNTSVSMNMADIIQALLRFNTDHYLKEHDYSTTPTCMDQTQEYDDMVGSVRNPLSQYGDSTEEAVMGRGGFTDYTIISNTPTQAVIDCIFTEPIFLSPFYWGKGNSTGFIGVQTMDWNFTFQSNAAFRMWSHAAGGLNAPGVIDSSQIAFSNFGQLNANPFAYGSAVPQLLFNYITPQELQTIPNAMEYPYFNIDRYPTDFPPIGPNASTTLVSQNIQLQSIPRRIYIYARNTNSVLNSAPTFTDTYLTINGLTINWNNRSGLFSSATQRDLYKVSVKNHCNMSWTQWSGGPVYANGSLATRVGTVGSILCVEFGTDIGLSDTECAGLLGTYQLQISVDVTNKNQINNVTPTLYIIAVSEGVFNILNNRSISQIGVVSKQDVLDAKQNISDYVDYETIQDVNGGNFLSGISKFGQNIFEKIRAAAEKVYEFGKKVAPYIEKGIDIASKVAPLLAMAAGRRKRGGVLVGGAPVGGKMMNRSKLRDRLRRI
jgi:hypothetical protein